MSKDKSYVINVFFKSRPDLEGNFTFMSEPKQASTFACSCIRLGNMQNPHYLILPMISLYNGLFIQRRLTFNNL